jgi:hypothetical protein
MKAQLIHTLRSTVRADGEPSSPMVARVMAFGSGN